MKKYSTKKNLALGFMIPCIAFGGAFGTKAISTKIFEDNDLNNIFIKSKIERDIEYYGGDIRYIDVNEDLYKKIIKSDLEYCNHLKLKKGIIKIGYDITTVNPIELKQFNLAISHLNSLFEIINPRYQFKIGEYSKLKSDIYISCKSLHSEINPNNVIGALTIPKYDKLNPSILKRAEIWFNSDANLTVQQLSYYMLHEMMHILYGSPDIDYRMSKTFSLYNYDDVAYIVTKLKNEQNEDFCSLLPTDVSTLIAIYGDSSKEENRKAYLKLLHDVLEDNKAVFDGKYYSQQYYEKDYQLPDYKEEQTL